jgi:LuxR family maltose regulon positive regulatory protein
VAKLERQEPGLIPVLRRRAAGWYVRQGMDEDALEYSIAAGDVDEAARLVQKLWLPTHRQGRAATLQRWFRWLEDRDGIARHPMLAVQAACFAADIGRPAEAERWAGVVDRWQFGDATQPDDPSAEAWAAIMRASLCRQGVEQMRADADEAVRRCAEQHIVAPVATLLQGIARIMCGDLDGGGDALREETLSAGQEVAAPYVLAALWCERSLVAMARKQWGGAESFAGQARAVLRLAGIEDSHVTPLVCAVQARVALHRGDVTAVRRELVSAQRLRHLLTYAYPYAAVQARIELTRVHLALADLAGARTLMWEIDELLQRRPGLGTLVGEAKALRAQLSRQRGAGSPGASALTAAELRVLPLLASHLTAAEIAAELSVSVHTVKSQQSSLYRKLGTSSRSQAVTRARELGLLEG